MASRIRRISHLFADFMANEKASGIVLMTVTILSLLLTNSAWGEGYLHFWHHKVGIEGGLFGNPDMPFYFSIEHWVNDGLMAIFFLLVGLEIERELYIGELSSRKKALMPFVGALGGMLVPALLYLIFNVNTPTQHGFGIPMATDIAFAVGALSLLGARVPLSLRIFLTALAVIDDLGAIVVIALFYASNFSGPYLLITAILIGILFGLNRIKFKSLPVYLGLGVLLWYAMMQSGLHATLAGVILAFAIPFEDGSPDTVSYKLQHILHKPVAFGIMPIFALANTALVLDASSWNATDAHSWGIAAGLVLGKPLGIVLICWLTVKLGIGQLGSGVRWRDMLGAGMLAGIGFTMSMFVTNLAFNDLSNAAYLVGSGKITILISSTLAAILGYLWLSFVLPKGASMGQEKVVVVENVDSTDRVVDVG